MEPSVNGKEFVNYILDGVKFYIAKPFKWPVYNDPYDVHIDSILGYT